MLTSTYLDSLDIGTSYQVRVNALSDIGDGPVGDITVQLTYNGMTNYVQILFTIIFIMPIASSVFPWNPLVQSSKLF